MKRKKMKNLVRLVLGFVLGVTVLIGWMANQRVMYKETPSPEQKTEKHPNRLIREKSPYLLQHAYNPVDWYPWGEEAFERARRENKPIFLSIGYSTCHWCHVMERESFDDPEVARLMNEVFVSIKVDREERPDIDNIYMTVSQMLTGGGGWPLTILMTPDKKPFFAGTYFPKESRFGRTGMLDLVPRIKEVWTKQRDKVLNSANQITSALQQASDDSPGEELGIPTLKVAYEQLTDRFDKEYGGFGSAPKFPTPHNLLFLLRYWKRTGDEKALEMVEKTLQAMRRGGMYDHVGFGFHRYSTDPQWLLPHFEKMV
ncbi:MAG: thioredoxin domain-containing protein, partial [Nitrospira sp.]|nr:thioredoxin domain-containing protein [Nitrospira sp.]